jgi:hypothetical protein
MHSNKMVLIYTDPSTQADHAWYILTLHHMLVIGRTTTVKII